MTVLISSFLPVIELLKVLVNTTFIPSTISIRLPFGAHPEKGISGGPREGPEELGLGGGGGGGGGGGVGTPPPPPPNFMFKVLITPEWSDELLHTASFNCGV